MISFGSTADYIQFYYAILTIFLLLNIVGKRLLNRKIGLILAGVLSLIFAIIFGNRSIDIGSDTYSYYQAFENARYIKIKEILNFGSDPVIYIYFKAIRSFATANWALGLVSGIFTFLCYVFAQQVCKTNKFGDPFTLYILIMYSFTVFNCEINIIRGGLGMVFWTISTIYLYQRKTLPYIIFTIIALFTHFSTIIFTLITLMAFFFKWRISKSAILILGTIAAAAIGISVLNVTNFNSIGLEKAANYANNADSIDYQTGFRPTFVMYNLGFFLIPLFLKKYLNDLQGYYIRLYTLCTIVFFLWFTIPYSDRIGAFSWFLIPIVIYFPLVRRYGNNSTVITLSCFAYGLINYLI